MWEELFQKVKTRLDLMSSRPRRPKDPHSPVTCSSSAPRCQQVVLMEEFEAENKVCKNCGYHARLSSRERLELTVDNQTFKEYDTLYEKQKPHRLSRLRGEDPGAAGKDGAVRCCGHRRVRDHGEPCVIAVMDSRFMMASMGSVVGRKLPTPLKGPPKTPSSSSSPLREAPGCRRGSFP